MMIDNSLKTNPVEISEASNQNFIFVSVDPVEVIYIVDSLDRKKGTVP